MNTTVVRSVTLALLLAACASKPPAEALARPQPVAEPAPPPRALLPPDLSAETRARVDEVVDARVYATAGLGWTGDPAPEHIAVQQSASAPTPCPRSTG